MYQVKAVIILMTMLLFVSVSRAELLYHRDTLHILGNYGREVSISLPNRFVVDSIAPGYEYPCSLSYNGIFFATLGNRVTCPCCPSWLIGAPRAFYVPRQNPINLSAPLILRDTAKFIKLDTTWNTTQCNLPRNANPVMIFVNPSKIYRTTYLLVRVNRVYLDIRRPTQSGGGSLGYPVTTCNNMLVVDMWLQMDGTTDFKGADLTSVRGDRKASCRAPALLSHNEREVLYDLQGHPLSSAASLRLPLGCYVVKNGARLEKRLLLTPRK